VIASRAMFHGRLAAIVVLACAVAVPASAEIVNRIVATVDGDPITAHEVRRYGADRRAQGYSESDLLEAVITDKILEKEIAARKIAVKPDAIDRYVAEVISRNKMTEDEFKAVLKKQGLTFEEYRTRIKGEIERTQLLGQEMRGVEAVTVGDDEVQRYYEAHRAEFGHRTGVTVRDIFFPFQQEMTRPDVMRLMEQAKAVKQMADAGQPFEALARRYSQGPGAEQGGLIGTFRKGEMAPQLDQAAFMLEVGDVSPPIVTPTGIHVIKVDAVQIGGTVEFEQVKDAIRQALQVQAENARVREWIAKNLRDRHHVEVLN
jgi:peptidyl-prolyl cis-trans isomerase SurA